MLKWTVSPERSPERDHRSKHKTDVFRFDFALCPESLVSVAIQLRRGMQGYRGSWSLTLGFGVEEERQRWTPALKKKKWPRVDDEEACRSWRSSLRDADEDEEGTAVARFHGSGGVVGGHGDDSEV